MPTNPPSAQGARPRPSRVLSAATRPALPLRDVQPSDRAADSSISAHLRKGLNVRECLHAAAQRPVVTACRPAARSVSQSLRSFESRLHWHCHFIQKLVRTRYRVVQRQRFDGLRNEGALTPNEQRRLQAFCNWPHRLTVDRSACAAWRPRGSTSHARHVDELCCLPAGCTGATPDRTWRGV
jgi:deoxyribodipyrimidine photolyase